jgi:hypothetical protein
MDDKQIQEVNEFRETLATRSGRGNVQFLARLVEDSSPLENRGITRLALKRSEEHADEWSLLTQLRNYGATPAEVILNLSVNGQIFRRGRVSIAANGTTSVTDDFTSPGGGLLQAEIATADELNADNRAQIELPTSQPISVAVLTARDSFITRLRMVLSANPYVHADFMTPGTKPKADVIIYDGPVPADAAAANSISFAAVLRGSSPPHRVRLANWNVEHPVTHWIQSRDVSVRVAEPLEARQGDVVLASSADASKEPLILARQENGYRSVIVGFDPLDSNFTMEPAFPLLVAASMEWMTRQIGESSEGLTAGALDLSGAIASIVAPSGQSVPFARNGDGVHLFAAESGLYHLTGAGGAASFAVNVPPLPTGRWRPTAEEEASVEAEPIAAPQRDLWRWFAGIALLAIWLEWLFFYFVWPVAHKRTGRDIPANRAGGTDYSAGQREEPVGKLVGRTP